MNPRSVDHDLKQGYGRELAVAALLEVRPNILSQESKVGVAVANDTDAEPDECALVVLNTLVEVMEAVCLCAVGGGEWKERSSNLNTLDTFIGANGSISAGENGIRWLVGPVVLEEILEAAVVDYALCTVDDGENLLRPGK